MKVYTRIGALQDTQAFYEDRATNELLAHLDLAAAQSVFEFGCGTGRFAERVLNGQLPPTARYKGIDLTPGMVELAQKRVARFAPRATVLLSDGSPPTAEPTGIYDRFISNFVFDLLSVDDIRAVVAEAHRMLAPGGLLGLSGLTAGFTPVTRVTAQIWSVVHRFRPQLVGGCRALELRDFLQQSHWHVRHVAYVAPLGIALQAVVAQRA
jgi:SAM-dependent methyltransferase